MWRAMVSEMRLAFRMTFGNQRPKRATGHLSSLAWAADRHLLKGYLLGLPVFLVGAVLALRFGGPPQSVQKDSIVMFAILLPFALASNALWFYFAARSRAKAQDSASNLTP